jgi:hypothetical protein
MAIEEHMQGLPFLHGVRSDFVEWYDTMDKAAEAIKELINQNPYPDKGIPLNPVRVFKDYLEGTIYKAH